MPHDARGRRRIRTLSRSAVGAIFGAALLLTLVALGAVWEHSGALEAGDWAQRTIEIVRQAGVVRQRLTEAETGQRGYLLTGDPAYRVPYDQNAAQVSGELDRLRRLMRDDPEQQRRVDALAPTIAAKLQELARTVQLGAAGDRQGALDVVQTGVGKNSMEQIRVGLDGIAAAARKTLQDRLETRTTRSWRSVFFIVLGNALALITIGIAALILTRLLGRALAAESRRRESEARLYVTLRSIGDAVMATDADGHVVFMNHVAQDLTGWTERDAQGKPLAEVFHIVNEQSRATVESPVERVIREGKIVGLANHTLLIARDGRELPIDDSGAPIRDGAGELMGVVLVFRDVSERNRAEAAERQALWAEVAREQAERANEAKDSFLAVLSHELRSPLSAMLAWTRVLQQSPDDVAKRARAIAVLDRNLTVQANLINDLLDVSRIVSGKFELERSPLDLVEELRECLDALQPMVVERGITLTRHVDVPQLVMTGDAQRLTQVMRNLVDNAIKFTPEGGRIDVRLAREGAGAVFSVADSGEGFAPELASIIFDRFEQRSDPHNRRYGGLGLGLAIVRHIVVQHGGTVHASSAGLGQGAVFTICIPAPAAASVPSAAALPDEQAVDLAGIRVLLVEDDADWREAVTLRLRQSGADVIAAASVAEAMARFETARPQVVVSDIGMPQQDGYDLLHEIRKRGGALPRMVAMTGFADGSTREDCRRLGFDVFLAKPFEPGHLVATIGHLLNAS